MKTLGMQTHMEFPFSKVKRTVQDLIHDRGKSELQTVLQRWGNFGI